MACTSLVKMAQNENWLFFPRRFIYVNNSYRKICTDVSVDVNGHLVSLHLDSSFIL